MVPKMNYLCRTLGPAAALLADLFSKHILNTAAAIHGCDTATAPLWTLKIKDGGLGLQLPSLLLTPAYLSSLCLVAKDLNSLVDPGSSPRHTFPRIWAALSEAHALLHPFFSDHFESRPQSPLKGLFGKSPEDTWAIYTRPDAPRKKLQKELTGPIYQALQKTYRSNLAPGLQQHHDAITYSKLGSRHLVVTPTNDITTFSNIQWRTLFNFRFSIPIPALRTRGLCISCGAVSLTPLNTNTHALTCNSQKRLGSTVRHDLVLLVIDDFLTSIGVPHVNEPQLFRHHDSNTKPDRVYHLPGQPKVVDMTIHSPTAHSQAGKPNNSSAVLKAADTQKNYKYNDLSTKMGYKFIPLSATPYGAVGKPFEDFLVLIANASEELGGQSYEQALTLLQNNITMTIQKANVEILLQAQAFSSSLNRQNQPRDNLEPTHYTPAHTQNIPVQPKQHPLLLSLLNFKLPHSHCVNDANFHIPEGIVLFARNLHLNRSIFIPKAVTYAQVIQSFPLPDLPYNPANHLALAFLHSLSSPPLPLPLNPLLQSLPSRSPSVSLDNPISPSQAAMVLPATSTDPSDSTYPESLSPEPSLSLDPTSTHDSLSSSHPEPPFDPTLMARTSSPPPAPAANPPEDTPASSSPYVPPFDPTSLAQLASTLPAPATFPTDDALELFFLQPTPISQDRLPSPSTHCQSSL